ncbi:MAG: transglycosylase SLT domain-containing protein [Burkholderiaceae bacterium]
MTSSKLTSLACAAFLSLGASLPAQANDISLFAYSPTQSFDPNDPLMAAVESSEVDVWGRIRKGFAIPDLDNPLVTTQTTWYSSRPDYIHRTTTRASRYLYHVVQELEKRGMPTELALLPFIESAFNPQAYSTAKAAGMWQFIPSTGRAFDLKQNVFKDERRDVIASTDAALTYLQKLYGMFGDWQLALAAYNWGEGSVQRAIKKARAAGEPITFNGLSAFMPAETKNYVPKLQAVKNIIASPGQYGITLPRVDNQPYFVTVNKTRDIDIKVAAQLAELPMEEFKALNPQFNRPIITGSPDTQILLPQSNAEKFKANLSKWTKALSTWTAHKVTNARERIETLAAKFKTTPEVIREANNIPPNMRLKQGSTILVPKAEHEIDKNISTELVDNATLLVEPDVPDSRKIFVKAGKNDTVASIARRHRVSASQVKSWNNLKGDKLARGQTLALHVPYKAKRGTRKTATRVAAAKKKSTAKNERKVAQKSTKPAQKSKVAKSSKSGTRTIVSVSTLR